MEVHWSRFDNLILLLEGFEDEDDGDQHSEAFLGEAGDVPDQGAQIEHHYDEQEQTHPDADPETKLQVVPFSVTGNLKCVICFFFRWFFI